MHFLNETLAAERLGLGAKTLRNLRCIGGGPTYIKAGKRVLYDPADLDGWMNARKVRNTTEAAALRECEAM